MFEVMIQRRAAGFAAVEGALLKVDKQAPAALRWIMTSNKAHLVALPPNMRLLERIAPEARCRQFIMLSQPPARQARFAALKARHGSNFVPDADRKPERKIQCQFSAGDPCQANLLPCRAFRAAKRACRAGG